MGVVGLYPNIPHDEGLSTLKKRPNERDKKDVSTDTLVEKTLKQKRGSGIETKFAPPYSILFMAELEEKILEIVYNKLYLWLRNIDDIFFIWEHKEEKLRNLVETLNEIHPTIKFTVE